MPKFRVFLTSCAFALLGVSAALASSNPAYLDPRNGSDLNPCTLALPCATLNFALSQSVVGGQLIILSPGNFGPIKLTGAFSISGVDPASDFSIVANPAASVGCIGAAAGSCGTNSGYAVEFAAASTDNLKMGYLLMSAGPSGNGAFRFTSGGKIQLVHSVFRGNGTATTPIVGLYPNNGATSQAQVYFANNDVGFHTNGGAVEVTPVGTTSMKLHFNHVEVHNANYGIRTDGSALSNSSAVVASFISESEFFSFNVAAVNAFSTSGTGTVNAVFDTVRILNANQALKANGPQSFVVLTNNTVSGNAFGILVSNGAVVTSSGNNTVFGNTTDINVTSGGVLNTQAMQ